MDNSRIDPAKLEMFETMPIPKAVLKNALPAIAGMLMMLAYNLADTFFIAQTKNDLQVAAVSIAMPVFLIFMALGNMLGAGGASVISRSLGAGRHEYASKVSAFCMWASIGLGALVSIIMWVFMTPLLGLIGTSPETEAFTRSYLTIVAFGGPMMLFANCFSNIIRAEGQAASAMTGLLIGNCTNILLDPVFILLLGMGITGAAFATIIGNALATIYYLQYFLRKKSSLSISPKHFTIGDKVLTGVIAIGLPASLGQLLMSVSQVFINGLLAGYSDMAVAALGVAMRIGLINCTFCIGLGQGAQPLLGYCFGGRLLERYKGIFRFSMIFAIVLAVTVTGLCYLFLEQIVGVFLTGEEAYALGLRFSRMILSTCALFGVFFLITSALQAMGAAIPTFAISISRQGIVFIPAIFILNALVGLNGLAWAQPAADVLSTILAGVMYIFVARRRFRLN